MSWAHPISSGWGTVDSGSSVVDSVVVGRSFTGLRNLYRLLYCASIIALIFGFFHVSTLTGWDADFYWAQLTSIWYDGDLELHNDLLANLNGPHKHYKFLTILRPDGGLRNSFSIGPACIDGIYAGPIVLLSKYFGEPRVTETLLVLTAIATIAKLWFLLLLLDFLLQHLGLTMMKRSAIVATVMGTPVFYYFLVEYGMSHDDSTLMTTLFVVAAVTWFGNHDRLHSLFLGLSAGLMVLSRWQDIIFLLFCLPAAGAILIRADSTRRIALCRGAITAVISFLCVISFQMVSWWKQFGHFIVIPQGAEFMKWSEPQIRELLFSGFHGLFTWSPIAFIGLVGLILGCFTLRGIDRWVMLGGILCVLGAIYVNACVDDWWGGWSYGARRFCSTLPFLVLGVVIVMRTAGKRIAILIVLATLCWAQFTYTCYDHRIDDLSLVLSGSSSPRSLTENARFIKEPKPAQSIVQEKLGDVHFAAAELFPSMEDTTTNNVLSLMLIIVVSILAIVGAKNVRHSRRLKKILIGGGLLYVTGLSLVVLLAFPDSSRLNETWAAFVNGSLSGDAIIDEGFPAAPVRFVEAVRLSKCGMNRKAAKLLEPFDKRDYRSMDIVWIMQMTGTKMKKSNLIYSGSEDSVPKNNPDRRTAMNIKCSPLAGAGGGL